MSEGRHSSKGKSFIQDSTLFTANYWKNSFPKICDVRRPSYIESLCMAGSSITDISVHRNIGMDFLFLAHIVEEQGSDSPSVGVRLREMYQLCLWSSESSSWYDRPCHCLHNNS